MNVENDESYVALSQEAAECEIHEVPICSLLAADSPRVNGEDERHIDMLAQLEKPLPPILVQRGTMRVIDGMHRLRAAMLLGSETIRVRFFDGTDAEAFILGVKVNSEHGLALTPADREAATVRIVGLYSDRSDRWIAAITGLSPGKVAAVRRRLAGGYELDRKRIGRDGRVRPLDGTDGRRRVIEKIAEHPDASLREIAKMADVSPGTVRNVRQRMDRGEDVVPRKLPDKDSMERLSKGRSYRKDGKTLTRASSTRDLGALLIMIQRDPSLRFSESGRSLLRLLEKLALGPSELASLVGAISPHCVYLIAEFAHSCADEWLQFAHGLQQRVDDMSS